MTKKIRARHKFYCCIFVQSNELFPCGSELFHLLESKKKKTRTQNKLYNCKFVQSENLFYCYVFVLQSNGYSGIAITYSLLGYCSSALREKKLKNRQKPQHNDHIALTLHKFSTIVLESHFEVNAMVKVQNTGTGFLLVNNVRTWQDHYTILLSIKKWNYSFKLALSYEIFFNTFPRARREQMN